MNRQENYEIATGSVLEFYESKEILCGVVLAVKDGRYNVLSERNREVNVTRSRVLYSGVQSLNLKLTRDEMLRQLASISQSRKELTGRVNVEELWSLLEGENGGYESREMAEFLFPLPLADTQVAAVQRALLQDRLFFQAKDAKFFPRPTDSVEQRRIELEREAEREQKLAASAQWLETVWNRKSGASAGSARQEMIEELKGYAVFGQDAPESSFVKEVLKTAGIPPQPQSAFRALIKLGIWKEDENLLLYEHGISSGFSPEAAAQAEHIAREDVIGSVRAGREDLTALNAFTVDSVLTRDYDDALSVRDLGEGRFEVGIHIADAAEFLSWGDPLDREAEQRASSIYLPDDRISMFPPSLSEGVFCLKAGEDRLALSFLISIDSEANVRQSRIVPSVIRIREQLTYHDVDERIQRGDSGLRTLHELAVKLRRKRLDNGAIILPLPEMQVSVNSVGMIQVSCYEKESPSQILVSEWMIAANAAAADYLAERNIPAVYRAQAECRPETECVQSEHELFRIYRQRRLFSRAELSTTPKPHCSLAIPHYTTVTSPIRRYTDLVVQRQLKRALKGKPEAYSRDDLEKVISTVSATQARVFMIQRKWTRYWLLKYIEQEDIESLNALVLDRNARYAHLLIPQLFIEANAPVPENPQFHQGEMVRIHVDKVVPREDVLKLKILEVPARQ